MGSGRDDARRSWSGDKPWAGELTLGQQGRCETYVCTACGVTLADERWRRYRCPGCGAIDSLRRSGRPAGPARTAGDENMTTDGVTATLN